MKIAFKLNPFTKYKKILTLLYIYIYIKHEKANIYKIQINILSKNHLF